MSSDSCCKTVQVIANTWARDSHDLFDFEAKQVTTKTFDVSKPMHCVRSGAEVQMVADEEALPNSGHLMRILQKEGLFYVAPGGAPHMKKLWLVVRDLKDRSHTLAKNDMVKLGRFKIRVRQMVTSSSEPVHPEEWLEDLGPICATSGRTSSGSSCRICLLEGNTAEDPLVSPCDCKGSVAHVHLSCLRQWIMARLNWSDSKPGSYYYRPQSCELCKALFPTYLYHQNRRVLLVDMPTPTPPFIVLECHERHQPRVGRVLHISSLAENKILKLGRGHESDVRIGDVSISRCHATIQFQEGRFVLEDMNSKFGTLVAMRESCAVETSTVSVQVGRTVLKLSLKASGTDVQEASASACDDKPKDDANEACTSL